MKEEISLGELLVTLLKFIKKHFILILAFGLAGGLGGYIKDIFTKPTYNSEMVICSDMVDRNLMKELLSDVTNAVNNKNDSFISSSFNIEENNSKEIKEISVSALSNENKYDAKAKLTNSRFEECIKIKCTTENKELFGKIQNGIFSTFSTNNHLNDIVSLRKKAYAENRKLIQDDISLIRKEREGIYKAIKSGEIKFEIGFLDNQNDFIFGYEKIAEYDELIARAVPAVILKSFNQNATITKSKLKSIVKFLVLGLFLGLAIAIYKEVKL